MDKEALKIWLPFIAAVLAVFATLLGIWVTLTATRWNRRDKRKNQEFASYERGEKSLQEAKDCLVEVQRL